MYSVCIFLDRSTLPQFIPDDPLVHGDRLKPSLGGRNHARRPLLPQGRAAVKTRRMNGRSRLKQFTNHSLFAIYIEAKCTHTH